MPLYRRESLKRTFESYPPDFDSGQRGYVITPENLTFVEFQTEFVQLYLDEEIDRPQDFPDGDTFCVGPNTDVLVLDGYPVVAVFRSGRVARQYLDHFDAVAYHAPVTLLRPEWSQRLKELAGLKAEGLRQAVETLGERPPGCPFQVAVICEVDQRHVYYRRADLAKFCLEVEVEFTEMMVLGW